MKKDEIEKEFFNLTKKVNINLNLIKKPCISYILAESNKIISYREIPGLLISSKNFKNRIKIKLKVKKGVLIKKPIILCFGILGEKGKQLVLPEIVLEERAQAKVFGHCIFPKAKKVSHQMKAKIKLGKNSKLFYQEKHYHGENFGANVLADFKIVLEDRSALENEFFLEQGSIGKLTINLNSVVNKNAFFSIFSKIVGKGKKDKVDVSDRVFLNREGSRSLIKLQGVAVNGGTILFKGEMVAKAKKSRGHIDCQEIVIGNSIAQSIPIVKVIHPDARVTHEASVGKVNQKQLETLMTRGLSEKEAIDFIIRGTLK